MQQFIRTSFLCLIAVLLSAPAAQAAFHLYDISEIYSSADGSVQFVEMFTASNNQQFLNGHTIVASQGASSTTFTFIGSGPTPTANAFLLIATASFEAACGIAPDFILPDNFLFDPNGSVEFGPGADIVSYTSLPLDGVMSLNFPGGATGTNSPENFAGDTCSLTAPGPSVPSIGPWGFAVLAALLGASGMFLVAVRHRVGDGIV